MMGHQRGLRPPPARYAAPMIARTPLASLLLAVLVPAALLLAAPIAAADDGAARRAERATVALLWIDAERADPVPLLAKLRVAVEEFDPPPALAIDTAELIARLPEAERKADRWRRDLLAAGGREVWWLVCFHAVFPAVTVVVPVPEGAEADRLLALAAGLDPLDGGEPVALAGAILAGADARFLDAAPLPGGDSAAAAALAAAREAVPGPLAAAIVLTPSDAYDQKTTDALAGLATELLGLNGDPREAPFRWAVIALSAPPETTLTAIVAPDVGAAPADLAAALERLWGREHAAGPGLSPFDRIRSALDVVAEGETAVLRLDAAAVDRIIHASAPLLVKARHEAVSSMIASKVRQITDAAISFTRDYNGRLPASLEALLEYLEADPADFAHPRSGRGFAVRSPAPEAPRITDVPDPGSFVIVHETFSVWPPEGAFVAYADGRVERIIDRERFEALTRP